ncbi:MAG TPA: DUF6677 family protein [Pirellulales bacterium]|jgi:hypothetical protein
MAETAPSNTAKPFEPAAIEIDLRDPWLAAFLAWLWPGLGHFYQRRWGKGGLYMTCILATFFYGMWLGGGRVVYASFRDADTHYAYVCQVGVGLPALPAVVQMIRTGGPTPKAPLMDGLMAPPMVNGQIVPRTWIDQQRADHPEDREYDPAYYGEVGNELGINPNYYRYEPLDPRRGGETTQLGEWNYRLGAYYDLGTVFTMIAGLLNVLVIWDAWGGPAGIPDTGDEEKDDEQKNGDQKKPDQSKPD